MLESQRLVLRPPSSEDVWDLAELQNDRASFEGDLRFKLVSPAALYSQVGQSNLVEADSLTLVVEDKASHRVVGTAHVHRAHPFLSIPEVGLYIYPPKLRKQGYGFEAIALLTRFLMDTRPIPKIILATNARNTFLVNALAMYGCPVEATLRRATFYAGKHHDYVLISISREAWGEVAQRPEIISALSTEPAL